MTTETDCICHDCGKPFHFDMLVPNDIWRQIAPRPDGGGLLCPTCIGHRLAGIGWPCARLSNPHARPDLMEEAERAHGEFADSRIKDNLTVIIARALARVDAAAEQRGRENERERCLSTIDACETGWRAKGWEDEATAATDLAAAIRRGEPSPALSVNSGE